MKYRLIEVDEIEATTAEQAQDRMIEEAPYCYGCYTIGDFDSLDDAREEMTRMRGNLRVPKKLSHQLYWFFGLCIFEIDDTDEDFIPDCVDWFIKEETDADEDEDF